MSTSPTKLPFGLPQLDAATGGMPSSGLVLLAGPAKSYRTTFAIQLMTEWARQGKRALLLTSDDPREVAARVDALDGTGVADRLHVITVSEGMAPLEALKRSTCQPSVIIVDDLALLLGDRARLTDQDAIRNALRGLGLYADVRQIPVLLLVSVVRSADLFELPDRNELLIAVRFTYTTYAAHTILALQPRPTGLLLHVLAARAGEPTTIPLRLLAGVRLVEEVLEAAQEPELDARLRKALDSAWRHADQAVEALGSAPAGHYDQRNRLADLIDHAEEVRREIKVWLDSLPVPE